MLFNMSCPNGTQRDGREPYYGMRRVMERHVHIALQEFMDRSAVAVPRSAWSCPAAEYYAQ